MTVQIGKVTKACNTYLQQTEEALLSASAAATTHVAKFYLHAAEMLAQLNHCNSRNSYYHKLAKLPWDSTTVQCLSKVVKELLLIDAVLCRDILHTPNRGAACELQVRPEGMW